MTSEATLKKVVVEALQQMYEEASPPAQYPDGVESYESHYLSATRQSDIIRETCKRYRVGARDRKRVEYTIYMGECPNTTPIFKHSK